MSIHIQNNFQVIHEEGKHPIKAWVNGVELEEEAKKQLLNVASMPFIHSHIAVMPDVHWGMGATVGSVIPTIGAVIPAAVGVDIGCGMMALQTSLPMSALPDSLKALRTAIENAVPHGRTNNGGPGDRGAWHDVPKENQAAWGSLFDLEFGIIKTKHPKAASRNTLNHLGTLGTGNHFIEICGDEAGQVWIVLHSGSRGLGNKFGSYFIELAKEDMRRYFVNLPDMDLSYFPEGTNNYKDYLQAVKFAQAFASANRRLMMDAICRVVQEVVGEFVIVGEVINCHHNYLNWEKHFGKNVIVTRKGAVRAQVGDYGLIPGSMGARSYVVRGKGCRESFNSCSHGAGRRMSRGRAKKSITLADHIRATEGVECRKDSEVLDESPAAYKDIDKVMEAQSDLVEVVHTLKQVLCVKG